jgi:selenocysteine lyase/cysteine desulfurase
VNLRAYLDYAGFGRLRPAAVAAMREAVDEVLPHGSAEVSRLFGARVTARRLMAGLLSCAPDEVAFVQNTSAGIHLVADGLDWRPGHEVVLFDRDFPAVVRPWQRLIRQGVRLAWVPMRDGGYEAQDVAAAIGPATRVIAVSHVNFATGFRVDLDQICALAARFGALVCVDAVQSLGALPLSVADTPVDFLAAGAHKWLCGPPGTGVFYCRRDRLDLLRAAPTGWYGFDGAPDLMKLPGHLRYDLPPRQAAARVEGGMYDIAGMAGLAAALAELADIEPGAVAARVSALAQRLCGGLASLGYSLANPRGLTRSGLGFGPGSGPGSGIVSIRCAEPERTQILDRLAAAGICVSCAAGLIRISPHYWTSDAEVDLVLDVMAIR